MMGQSTDKRVNKAADKLILEILRFAKEKSKHDIEIMINLHLALNATIEAILKKTREATIASLSEAVNETSRKKNIKHDDMVAG